MASKRSKTPKEESALLTALRFIKVAQNDDGHAAYMKHCYFAGGQVIGFDGVLGAGYPVADAMTAWPRTKLFIDALERVRGAYSMTQLDNASLVIKSGAYSVIIPCETDNMFPIEPDPPQWELGPSFIEAAEQASLFCTDGAQTVLQASVITLGPSLAGTNNTVIVEAWHGWGMPEGLVIPVALVNALKKVEHKLTHFGWTPERSITFHFENGSWIRSQLYQEPVPDFRRVLDAAQVAGCVTFPPDFFTALDAVEKHAIGNTVFVRDNKVCSHEVDELGAQHVCEGLPFTVAFDKRFMGKLRSIMTRADFTTYPDRVVMVGDKARAILLKVK